MILLKMLFSLNFCLWPLPRTLEVDSEVIYLGQKIGSPRITLLEGQKTQFLLVRDDGTRFNLELTPHGFTTGRYHFDYQFAMRRSLDETISRGKVNILQDTSGLISLDNGAIKVRLRVHNN
jgi:hypothetical protein